MIPSTLKLFCVARTALFTLLVLWFSLPAASIAQEQAQGYVYEDRLGTGQRDADDPGIEGVMVSNGREVVRTDENGFYTIGVEPEQILFAVKPAGYTFVVNEHYLPQFYYIHHPQGSPELNYEGIAPTGPLPSSIDFGFVPGPEARQQAFRAIAYADPQPWNHAQLSYYSEAIVQELIGTESDLVLILGDIMFDNLNLMDRYNEINAALRTPIINVLGNHDLNFDTDGNRYARETFKRHYGPTWYAFHHGDIFFMVLDNVDYRGQGNGYIGAIDPVQMQWIANTLRHVDADTRIVMLAHIPLYAPGRDDVASIITNNRDELMELLEPYDKVTFLAGHVHTTSHSFLRQEIGRRNINPLHQILTAAASGSWWGGPQTKNGIPVSTQRDGTPKGYHLFSFRGSEFSERFKAAGLPAAYQMRIESPGSTVRVDASGDLELLVNVFNGSERSVVHYQLNDQEPVAMEHLPLSISPFFRDMRENHPDRFSDWIQPIQSTHIWRASLPGPLPPGVHTITVYTRDMFGQQWTKRRLLEVH